MDFYCADFETNVTEETCELNPVWAWAICEFGNEEVKTGTTIESFFKHVKVYKNDSIIYFHNLGFDGNFIIDFALRLGYTPVQKLTQKSRNKEFTVLRNKGKLYEIAFKFSYATIKFWDSYKKLPMAISKMPKAFNFADKWTKGCIVYEEYRPCGHILSEEEKEYIKGDVIIDSVALSKANDLGIQKAKMTLGGNAYDDWKKRFIADFGVNNYNDAFMHYTPDEWLLAQDSYRGGICTVNPTIKGKLLKKFGRTYDVNSMYPAVMKNYPLPYGRGVSFEGKPDFENNKLWIANFDATFKLKKHAIAVYRPKHYSWIYPQGTMMVNSTDADNTIRVTLTSVDYFNFLQHYDIEVTNWNGGYYYECCTGMFDSYIDYWSELKIDAVKQGNKALKTVAKLMLNNLYGKFGQNVSDIHEMPYLDPITEIVKWENVENEFVCRDKKIDPFTGEEELKGVYTNNKYMPLATFVTSYARAILCDCIRKVGKRFCYCDTDSVHVLGSYDVEGLDVDSTKLGAWDLESEWAAARFYRPKAYQEFVCVQSGKTCTPYWDIKLAGCPSKALEGIDPIKDFVIGNVFRPKLIPKHVRGGVILEDVGYEFKETI